MHKKTQFNGPRNLRTVSFPDYAPEFIQIVYYLLEVDWKLTENIEVRY